MYAGVRADRTRSSMQVQGPDVFSAQGPRGAGRVANPRREVTQYAVLCVERAEAGLKYRY